MYLFVVKVHRGPTMSTLRVENAELTPFTSGTAEELLCLPFSGPDAAIPHTPPCAVCLWGQALQGFGNGTDMGVFGGLGFGYDGLANEISADQWRTGVNFVGSKSSARAWMRQEVGRVFL